MDDAPGHGLDPAQRRMLESEAAWHRHVQGDVPTAERALGEGCRVGGEGPVLICDGTQHPGGVSCGGRMAVRNISENGFSHAEAFHVDPPPVERPAIPTEIRVGPYRYRVVSDQAAIDRARAEAEHPHRVGETRYRELTVTVDPTLAPDRRAETLLHEIGHTCLQVAGTPDAKLQADDFLDHLIPTLLDTLRRNPALVRFLMTEA